MTSTRCATGAGATRLSWAGAWASYAPRSAQGCRSFPSPPSAGTTPHSSSPRAAGSRTGLDRVSGLKTKLRGSRLPIGLGFPFGLTIETIPTHLPLPAKIRTELLDPIHVDHDPERVDDREYVTSIYTEVQSAIQSGMDRLAKQRRFPVFA